MSVFVEITFGAEHFPVEKLNNIALNKGGVVGVLKRNPNELRGTVVPRHGYGFKWVATKGLRNAGTLVLTPRTDEAAAHLRQGKIIWVMELTGCSAAEAGSWVTASWGIKAGMEKGVALYAFKTKGCKGWLRFPGIGKGLHAWMKGWGFPETNLSPPRLEACAKVLAKL